MQNMTAPTAMHTSCGHEAERVEVEAVLDHTDVDLRLTGVKAADSAPEGDSNGGKGQVWWEGVQSTTWH